MGLLQRLRLKVGFSHLAHTMLLLNIDSFLAKCIWENFSHSPGLIWHLTPSLTSSIICFHNPFAAVVYWRVHSVLLSNVRVIELWARRPEKQLFSLAWQKCKDSFPCSLHGPQGLWGKTKEEPNDCSGLPDCLPHFSPLMSLPILSSHQCRLALALKRRAGW